MLKRIEPVLKAHNENNSHHPLQRKRVKLGDAASVKENRHYITLSRVLHIIKNVRIERYNVVDDITILTTAYGKKLEDKYKKMVFRPRSAGVIDNNGLVTIKKLFTFDATDKIENVKNGR